MKKFAFPMERVLEYRTHLQKNEKTILMEMRFRHAVLCRERDRTEARLLSCGREREEKCRKGALVKEIEGFFPYMEGLRKQLESQEKAIRESQGRIDRQTQKVVEVNRDKRGMEILKEKQFGLYQALSRKESERAIEEYVTAEGISAARQ